MEPITLFVVTLIVGGLSGVGLYLFRDAKERSDSHSPGPMAEVRSQQVPPRGRC